MAEFKKVLVTGGSGFVGKNLLPILRRQFSEVVAPRRCEFDLLDTSAARAMFEEHKPDLVFHLAGKVGGILANRDFPADFCRENMLLAANVVDSAWRADVRKFVTLIGGCSYPAKAPSPIREEELWCGYPQPESAPYSLAKAMSVELCKSYRRQHGFDAIVLVPGNIYGPHDNFDLQSSHVIPALIRKYLEAQSSGAKQVTAWGTGKPLRDFVYVGDACEGIALGARIHSGEEIINISSGTRVSIRELVETTAKICGFAGDIVWDSSKPDGQMDKGFDVSRMRSLLGFECKTSLREGLLKTIEWYRANPVR
jgi:GDP-L-fucose synthase